MNDAPRPAPSTRFIKNTLVLAGGQLAAQLVLVALMPVITRLYDTEAYGAFAVVVALGVTFVPAAALRLNVAVLLPDSPAQSRALAWLAAAACGLTASAALAVVWVFQRDIAGLLNLAADDSLLLLLPLLLLSGGSKLITDALAMRRRLFAPISSAAVTGALSDRAAGIGLGILSTLGAAALVWGRVLNFLGQSAVMLWAVVRRSKAPALPDWRALREAARDYYSFPLYAYSVVLQQLSRQLPVIFIGVFFSPLHAGLFALIQRVVAEPLQLIGAAVGRSFAQRSAEATHRDENLAVLALRLFDYALLLLWVPLSAVALLAPGLFGVIFGPSWAEAGRYLQFVYPVFLLGFLERSLIALFDVCRAQRQQMWFAVAVALVTSMAFGLALADYPLPVVLAAYTVGYVVLFGYRLNWILCRLQVTTARRRAFFQRQLARCAAHVAPLLLLFVALAGQIHWQGLLTVLYLSAWGYWRFRHDPYLGALLGADSGEANGASRR